jgi:hypothetical protein
VNSKEIIGTFERNVPKNFVAVVIIPTEKGLLGNQNTKAEAKGFNLCNQIRQRGQSVTWNLITLIEIMIPHLWHTQKIMSKFRRHYLYLTAFVSAARFT